MFQKLARFTPQLWIAQSSLFHTNSGLFISGGEACLVDPGIYPEELEEIARFLTEQKVAPRVIVLTHSHWDHILGPERFPGVRLITQASYITTMREHVDVPLKSIVAWAEKKQVRREWPFEIPWPDETFVDSTTLRVGEISLRLVHAPGHARDQLTIYQEESATLWAADMLSDLEIPFVSDSLSAYRRTLERLSSLDIAALVPGHGHPTTDEVEIRRRLNEDIAYLAQLQERVAQALAEGRGLQETVTFCADMRYRNPEENEGPHRMNVESAYVELGGEADQAKVGWSQEGLE
jgi:glyoxylase-like metal-dependent hydrolase (beta-lactamase superfamily II)